MPPPPPEGAPERQPGRYSQAAAAAARPKEPFAYQAAKLALAAPLAAIALGCLGNVALQSTAAADPQMHTVGTLVIGVISLLFVLVGIIMGAVALLAMRRLGAKGLLVRSLVGIVLSLGLLAAAGYEVYVLRALPRRIITAMTQRVTGDWQRVTTLNGEAARTNMSLDADGTGHWGIDAPKGRVDKAIHWQVGLKSLRLPPILVLKFDEPIESPQRIEGIHWQIVDASENQLKLEGETAGSPQEVYSRVK